MRIFLLTGEPSGDLHGAHLATALRALDPSITLTGVGGTRMREAGVTLVAESEHWGAIGIPEALRKVPHLWGEMRRLVRLLRGNPPDVLVLIDFGAFNVRLLRRLQGSGIRTVYYIPPGCWSRQRAPGQLPFLVDGIATPFPWSAENLRGAGAPSVVEWVGHPLLAYTQTEGTRAEARRRLGVSAERPVVALVPGSRRSEVRYVLPAFLAAMRHLAPAPLCLLSVAPSIGEAAIRRLVPADIEVRYLEGIDYDIIQAADAALVTSGTATLELACLDVPMVVAYRGSFATWLQYQLVVKLRGLPHIALPNILAESAVVPELLQGQANPVALAGALMPLLSDTPARRAQCDTFRQLRGWLGSDDAPARTARLILRVAHGDDATRAPVGVVTPAVPGE